MRKGIDVPAIFGSNVFNDETMRERLPKKIYAELKKTIETGGDLDQHVAEVVANEMKDWRYVIYGYKTIFSRFELPDTF